MDQPRGRLRRFGRGRRTVDAHETIVKQLDTQVVEITAVKGSTSATVDVASVDALATLAETFQTVVLHLAAGDSHAYLVLDDGVCFRYVVGDRSRFLSPPATSAAESANADGDARSSGHSR